VLSNHFVFAPIGAALEPFRLACNHCLSKVVVRHEHMLGLRLPCPKCQSEIQIPSSPPLAARQVTHAVQQVVNSAALTKAGDPEWEQMLASESFLTPTESGDESVARFRPVEDDAAGSSASTSVDANTTIPLTPMRESEKAPLHAQNWQSQGAAKRRQLLILATVGIAGSLLAIGCFAAFIQFVGTSPKPVQPVAQGPDKGLGADSGKSMSSTPINEVQIFSPTAVVVDDVVATQSATPEPSLASETSTNPLPLAHLDNADQRPSVDSEPIPETTAPTATTLHDVVIPPPSNQKTAEASAEAEPIKDALPDIFRLWEKEGIGGEKSKSDAGMGKNEIKEELDPQNAELEQELAIHPLAKPVPKWDERSKLALSSFNVKNTSLLRCIDLLGRIAGVGIGVDWESCRVAGIELSKPIDISATDKSLAEILDSLVESHQMVLSTNPDGTLLLSASTQAMNAGAVKDWSVSSLFQGGSDQPEDRQQAIETLIKLWGYENVCSFDGDKLVWTDAASAIQKGNIQASLCEMANLRNVPEPSPWHASKHPSLLFATSEWQKLADLLVNKVPMSVIVPERRPITEILMTAASETGIELIIDWKSVWEHGFVPNELSISVLRGRTFPQIANRYVTDFALQLVPIGKNSLLLTTADVRRKLIRVIPVALPKDFKLEDLKQSLRRIAPLGPDDRTRFRVVSIPGMVDMYFVRVCPPQVDELSDSDIVLSFGWPTK
jgi:hypothetical protein